MKTIDNQWEYSTVTGNCSECYVIQFLFRFRFVYLVGFAIWHQIVCGYAESRIKQQPFEEIMNCKLRTTWARLNVFGISDTSQFVAFIPMPKNLWDKGNAVTSDVSSEIFAFHMNAKFKAFTFASPYDLRTNRCSTEHFATQKMCSNATSIVDIWVRWRYLNIEFSRVCTRWVRHRLSCDACNRYIWAVNLYWDSSVQSARHKVVAGCWWTEIFHLIHFHRVLFVCVCFVWITFYLCASFSSAHTMRWQGILFEYLRQGKNTICKLNQFKVDLKQC